MDADRGSAAPESVGQRVHRLRRERELTEAELGAPVFSDAFVSAVEAGHHRPSPLALAILAQHLDIPTAALTDQPAATVADLDVRALGEDIVCQLEQIRPRLYTAPHEFLQELETLLAPYAAVLPQLPVLARYRLQYLRANAS